MQKVLQWKKSIKEYQNEFNSLQPNNLEKCRCGCTKFHKWGKYERYLVDKDGDYLIPIKRIRCIKCHLTYSFLPSFCVSKLYFSVDYIMLFLKVLILKLKFELGDKKRQAFAFLKKFTESENLWIVFLRAKSLDYLPNDKKERRIKMFTALLKIHKNQNLISSFFRETGRHFMAKNEGKTTYLSQ